MLDFCTVEDAKALTHFSARYDSVIEDAVKGVTEKCNNFIRRTLHREVGKVERFNVPRLDYGAKHVIWLEKRNILANTVVMELSTVRDYTDPLEVLMEAASYSVEADKGRIILYGYLPRALDGLRITYTGGYEAREAPYASAMDCPSSLRQAAAEQVVYDIDRAANLFGGGSNESADHKKSAPPKLNAYGLLESVAGAFVAYRKLLG